MDFPLLLESVVVGLTAGRFVYWFLGLMEEVRS
jgi:hypothetical protein